VVQGDRDSSFTLESKHGLFVTRQLGSQDLDGHVAPHRRLMRAIDRPHPAGSDLLVDPELFEQDSSDQWIGDLVVGNEKAAVVRAVFGAAPELRTATKANLPHFGRLSWTLVVRSIW
jgi:hypothetical protein